MVSVGPHIVVLASGEGTTAEAVAKAWAKKPDGPRIGLIITNSPKAGILKKFPDVESAVIDPDDEDAILKKIESGRYDLILLAGYMKKIGPKVVRRFGWCNDYKSPYQAMMLNTHPGLLPATKGLMGVDVQAAVLKQPLPRAGHTLHIVSEEYDEGPVVAEHEVEVKRNDTPEILFERVRASERKHLPKDIADFIAKRQKFLENK